MAWARGSGVDLGQRSGCSGRRSFVRGTGRVSLSAAQRRWSVPALATALVMLAGCSAEHTKTPPTPDPQAQSLQHAAVPIGLRRVSGAGFSLGVPGSYEESLATYPEGVTVSQWSEPHPQAPLSTAITVVREDAPKQRLPEQANLLEERLRDDGITPVREGLTWPGSRAAQVIRWGERRGGETDVRYIAQLMVETSRGTIFSVVTFGPLSTAEPEALPRLMLTFTVEE